MSDDIVLSALKTLLDRELWGMLSFPAVKGPGEPPVKMRERIRRMKSWLVVLQINIGSVNLPLCYHSQGGGRGQGRRIRKAISW